MRPRSEEQGQHGHFPPTLNFYSHSRSRVINRLKQHEAVSEAAHRSPHGETDKLSCLLMLHK